MAYILEVCVDSTASALAAKEGGADRLELCADLIVGGTTPSLALVRQVKETTGLPVHCYLSGRLGGIQQIAARVACDEVDLVLFFRDPLKADSGSSIEQNLLRLCDMHSVPIATNIATAEVLLRGLDQGDLDYREGMHPAIVEPLAPVTRAVC